ncbi:MAG: FAD-binding domain-containing protein [Pseudomonadota bacterium]
MTVLYWFKRDLRLEDNPALAAALAAGETVLPLYIAEPAYWAEPDASARQWDFVAETLQELQDQMGRLGAPLVVRVGDAVEVLDALHKAQGFSVMVSHEETGNGWSFARDRRVAAWARAAGVHWREVSQMAVIRRLAGRDGWAARRTAVMAQATLAAPSALRPIDIAPGAVPTAAQLGLSPDPCPDRQRGGRAQALDDMASFLNHRGQNYRRAMSAPGPGATACSRLSPYLAFGALSEREVVQAGQAKLAAANGSRQGWVGAMRSFEARLAWRPHFMQKLEDEPALEFRCLHPAYEMLRPRQSDPARLAAWASGQTGLPFVDACMRCLIATGWMNFRMRAMLVAVASYHLWLDWRATAPILARLFTDYEPGIHYPQVQMQSGTTGMNTIRIYNPVKQGKDQDPDGQFTRRWCPELAAIADVHLQEPWKAGNAGAVLGRAYPAPLVDPVEAARGAKARIYAVRSGARHRAEAARIIEKHASRKDRGAGRHFVNDRAPRTRKRGHDPDQLRFDL